MKDLKIYKLEFLFISMVTLTLSISAVLAIIGGILILIKPKILNYVIALWLLIFGILSLLS